MNMKKIITLVSAALVLLASVPAFAQGSFGAGYLSSTVVTKTGSTSSESSPMNGFYAGIGYTVPIAGALNLTPGLYYGFATKDVALGKRQDHYINVPLHFSIGFGTTRDLRLFVYGGPNISYTLASKTIANQTSIDLLGDNAKRLDVLLGGGIGIEFIETFRVNIGYDFGMLNHASSNNYTVKRNQLTVGAAIIF